MAKAKKSPMRKTRKLTGTQVSRLRELFKKAMLDADFRRQLLANPRKVLAQYGIGLNAAQLRQLDKAKNTLLKKAREIEKSAVNAAQKLGKQARIIGMPTIQ